MYIECYQGYGRITVKFIEQDALFENCWVLSAFTKKIIGIKEITKDDSLKDYGAKVVFEDGLTLRQYQYMGKSESKELWSHLQDIGFKPTKETEKLLKKMNKS